MKTEHLVLNMPDGLLKKVQGDVAEAVGPATDFGGVTLPPGVVSKLIISVLANVQSPYVRERLKPLEKKAETPKPKPKTETEKEEKAEKEAPPAAPTTRLTPEVKATATPVDKDFETEFPVTKSFKRLDKLSTEMQAAYVFENANQTEVLLKPKDGNAPEPVAAEVNTVKVKIFAPPARGTSPRRVVKR